MPSLKDVTQGEQPFVAFRNLQNAKNHFIEVKTYKNIRGSDTT